jgi:hypothetical protein
MASISPTFYAPLNPKNREIRVLSINPNFDADSRIVCKIEVQSLNKSFTYTALSYCWGAKSQKPVIEIEGEKVTITPNLFAALRQLRNVTDTVKIWVDAVCIDQLNLEERESQVSMMGQIYQHARIVYAWLGEEADGSEAGMSLLQNLQIICFGGNISQLKSLRRESFIIGWRALIPLLRRSYWTRAWILQEILVAENVMVCCGRFQVAWPTLCVLISTIVPEWCLDASDATDLISSTLADLNYFFHDMSKLSQLSLQRQKTRSSEQTPSTGLLDLLDCLTMSRWRFATDKRDHINSVLSLAEVTYVRPNYRKSLAWLLREVVVQDIKTRGNLDILSGCKHYIMDERDLKLFSEAVRYELCQNDQLVKDLASVEKVLGRSPKMEESDVEQHPIWFEKSVQYLEGLYNTLREDASDFWFENEPGHTFSGTRAKYSLEALSSSLAHMRKRYHGGTSNAVLQHILDFTSTLRCFLYYHRKNILDRLVNACLPTWAANWTLPILSANQNILLRDRSRDKYRAGGNTSPRVRFDDRRQKMFISALVVDKVEYLPQPARSDPIKEYWRYCSQLRIPSGCPYGSESDKMEAFCQLLSLGIKPLSQMTLRTAFLEELLDNSQVSEDIISSIYQDWVGDVRRRLFITLSGYFGAGAATVRQDDLVVIPFGGKVPMIFRQIGDVYHLVEECCKFVPVLISLCLANVIKTFKDLWMVLRSSFQNIITENTENSVLYNKMN